MASKPKKGAGPSKLATIAYPNQMGVVRNGTLFLVETKVSADYLPAFPAATASKLASYDLSTPAKPARKGEVTIYAPWWMVALKNGAVLYLAAVREGDAEPAMMDIVVIDVSSPHAPQIAARVPTEAAYVADSREPILLVSGTHLLFCSRADAKLHIFDLAQPLAPTKVTELALPATPQEGFADDEGALITQLGGPVFDVRGAGSTWTVKETAFTGYSKVVRHAGRYYAPSGQFLNHLAWYAASGDKIDETKLGPTSTHLHLDAGTGKLVTTGDVLSVWQLGSDAPELVGKKKAESLQSKRLTAHEGIVCVPERANARAADKKKAFAFSLWSAG